MRIERERERAGRSAIPGAQHPLVFRALKDPARASFARLSGELLNEPLPLSIPPLPAERRMTEREILIESSWKMSGSFCSYGEVNYYARVNIRERS